MTGALEAFARFFGIGTDFVGASAGQSDDALEGAPPPALNDPPRFDPAAKFC